MANDDNQQHPFTPYRNDQESNCPVANEGPDAGKPYIPNGWQDQPFEENTFEEGSKKL